MHDPHAYEKILTLILAVFIATFAQAQVIESSSRSTVAYIKSDGAVESSSRATIGYARGVKKEWAAVVFFFFKLY